MPAFVVPFVFVLDPAGVGILLSVPEAGGLPALITVILAAAAGVAVVAAALQGRLLTPLAVWERGALIVGGFLLMFPDLADDWLAPVMFATHGQLRWAGLALALAVLAYHYVRARRLPGANAPKI